MDKKLIHDSTKTFRPIIYQFLVALEKCFEMQNDESIWIEKYGDVTSSSGEQIEVKDYQKNLTDLDHNAWKTLKNWLDDGFDDSSYHSFILITTQKISETSGFIDWNQKNKEEKLQILQDISNEFDKKKEKTKAKDTQKLLADVLDSTKKDKLLNILDKFIINSEYEKDEELYKRLIETKTDGILPEKKDEYIDSLLGYIIKPEITLGGWEIKNQLFRQKTNSLIETYTSATKIFPKINFELLAENIDEHKTYQFIKKIEEIGYDEVKNDAIYDFIYTRRILNEELRNFEISKKEYDAYEDEILRSYQSKHRKASRSTNTLNCIDKSKDLFDDTVGEPAPNFYNFNDTPKIYRNGLLHELANDEVDVNKLVWKLEIPDE